MISFRLRHPIAALAAGAVLAAAGCGGSDEDTKGAELPAAAVRSLDQRLDEIQRRYDNATEKDNSGACDDIAEDSFPAVKKIIDGLPQDVDSDLRNATTESFANLQQLTDEGCQDVSTSTEPETTPTEPETVPTQPETTPPETNTTPPETDTTPPQTTPQTTPDNGNGGTGGSGGQNPRADSPQGGGTEAPSGTGQ